MAETLLSTDLTDRFGGIARLYGVHGLQRLVTARVCVVGIGGVGSWVVEALARSGVGTIGLVDLDAICITNTNRQLHTLTNTVGRSKVEAMAARAAAIAPHAELVCIEEFFGPATVETVLGRGWDWVVDAIDHVPSKVLLLAECKRRGVAVVTCGGAGGRRDPSRVRTTELARTGHDGLLREVRRRLRSEVAPAADGWGIPAVFSDEPAVYPGADGTVCARPDPAVSLALDCSSGFGTASFVTGAFGLQAAAVVVGAVAASGQ